ncbi:MAG: M36 family metallopeptidase [Ignavibacteriae bacterium]|nr:M36 family metallopeptidase [Ignavibacteriota bacterium]
MKPVYHFPPLVLVVLLTSHSSLSSSQNSYVYKTNARIEASTGIPRALYFQNEGPYQGTPEQMARQYLQKQSKTLRLNKSLRDLKTERVQESPMGYHVTFQQTYENIPVYRSDIVVTIDRNNKVVFTVNNYKPNLKLRTITAKISDSQAIHIARNHLKVRGKLIGEQSATLMVYAEDAKRPRLSYRVIIPTENPLGDWEVFVDAQSGEVFSVTDMAQYFGTDDRRQVHDRKTVVDGTGYVYDPDPVTTGGTVYPDSNDADSPQLDAQRVLVTLRDITLNASVYSLQGPHVQISDFESPTDTFTTPAHPDSFRFHRSQQAFEEVMVYYHIDKTQRYIQSLGFNNIQNLSVPADPHGLNGQDNSHYIPSTNKIAFGEGGVDDAEDADVIWHEYGHAIQNGQKPGWSASGGEARHIGEGFGDYWAGSYSRNGWANGADMVFNWDGTASTGALRPLNDPRIYPRNGVASLEVHNAGQIWSSVLMLIWGDLGRAITDKLVLQSHYLLGASPTMRDNACAIIQADRSLYGGSHVNTLLQRFISRGFLRVDIEFVIDDTGSMGEEIGGVRDALTAFLATFREDTCVVFQLTTFKDGVSQNNLTIDLTEIRNQVASLYASGGGDCPEASVEALNAVKDTIRRGGVILFATDADPHPGLSLNSTISALRARGIRVNVLLSGACDGGFADAVGHGEVSSDNEADDDRGRVINPAIGPDGHTYRRQIASSDTLILGYDDFVEVNLPFSFPFCGRSYTSTFVNANGYLTFGNGVYEYYPSPYSLMEGPRRICGWWTDLLPPSGGTIVATQVGSEFHISFTSIPEAYTGNTVSFTIRLRPDGSFRIDYGSMTVQNGLVGFSAGNNSATPPAEIDLSTSSQPIQKAAYGTAYEHFTSNDNDLASLSIEFAACTYIPPTGTITGMKFNDVNANGVRDSLEQGIQGWTMYASGAVYRTTMTDSLGNYQFIDLPAGYYSISEEYRSSWSQTYPPLGYYYLLLDSGVTLQNNDFGNYLASSITGYKFFDADTNGVYDPGEASLYGWEIKIQGPRNDSTITYGYYSFSDLPPGTYTITEELMLGWRQTYPPSGSWTVVIDTPGSSFTNIDFGNYAPTCEVYGMKFHDKNTNGIKDPGESGLTGWNIYLSGTSYLYTVTDSVGNYSFTNVIPGTYSLSEGLKSGWYQTVGVGTITLDPGEVLLNHDFGNYRPPNSIEAFSQLAYETGGFFAYVPEVNSGDSADLNRFKNIAYNIVQGGITKSIGLTQPSKVPVGSTLLLTVSGSNTNFQPGTMMSISGGGITVSNVSVISPIQLVADITVDPGAALGFRDVMTVTDLGGGILDTAFGLGSLEVVTAPLFPTIIGVSPTAAAIKETLTVTISAINTHFADSSILDMGAGIAIKAVTALSATKLQGTITIDSAADLGFRNITVTTGSEFADESVPGPFLIISEAPEIAVIADVTPNSGNQGDSLTIAIIGSNTNFQDGVTEVSFSSSGINVLAVRVLSPTQLEADIQIDSLAPLGYRDVFVTTGPEVATALSAFNVAARPVEVIENRPLPTSFMLRQSYPNPFNPVAFVEFDVPTHSSVTLKVYDVLGREVRTVIDEEEYKPGTYRISVDGSKLASGVYFYSLRANSASTSYYENRKMVLVK